MASPGMMRVGLVFLSRSSKLLFKHSLPSRVRQFHGGTLGRQPGLLSHCSRLHVSRMSSKVSTLDLSGVYPPVVTPFNKEEGIDYGKLEENFSKWNDIPFKGTANKEKVKWFMSKPFELRSVDIFFVEI